MKTNYDTDTDCDWRRVNQFRREQQQRIAEQKCPAPSLLSANKKLLRLARELNTNVDEDNIRIA